MQVQDAKKPQYLGVVQGLTRIWKMEGLKGMMKGNGANCIRIMPNSAVKFLTYEELASLILRKMRETDPDANMTPLLRLCAGAGAGIVAMSATYPLDMVRGRLTVQASGKGAQYRGIMHATRLIVQQEGLNALYKGWLPSVLGVIPYVGLNFAVYETLKDWLLQQKGLKNDQDLSVTTRLTCGAIAGSVGQTVAFPLDVVRRRLQVSGWQGAKEVTGDALQNVTKKKGVTTYTGMVDCFVKTVQEEGVRALFRGLMPNYLKVAPSIAIAFVTYEQCKKGLGVELRIGD